uniref:Uncharacterized protein n=1 Tax=Pararge aegeria TaxID=116150 RepID=S4PXQ3_9NEOP
MSYKFKAYLKKTVVPRRPMLKSMTCQAKTLSQCIKYIFLLYTKGMHIADFNNFGHDANVLFDFRIKIIN